LENFIAAIEQAAGVKAQKNYLPMQAGDVYQTYADVERLNSNICFKPTTQLNQGLISFVDWFITQNKR
jgi:UDP-glucuronate 4-epimerase